MQVGYEITFIYVHASNSVTWAPSDLPDMYICLRAESKTLSS